MSASVPVNTPTPSRPPASPRPPTKLALLGAFEGTVIGGLIVSAGSALIALARGIS